MESLHELITEYKAQMGKGRIQAAYRGLMDYIMSLRLHLQGKYPGYAVSGAIYPGYLDMTYFSFTPTSLKKLKLKIAIVFIHETCRFEVWLAGANKKVQAQYWELFKEKEWENYRVPSPAKGVDAIMESVLVADPDYRDLDTLTRQIETGTLSFIKNVEDFLNRA